MALPESGPLSLGDIAKEMNISLSNVSLSTQSTTGVNQNSPSKPDGEAPYAISEFYGYDNDATASTAYQSTPGSRDSGEACAFSLTETYYHDGSGSLPGIGDNVYSDSGLTNSLNTNFYALQNGTFIQVDVGIVASIDEC